MSDSWGKFSHCRSKNKRGMYTIDTETAAAEDKEIALEYVENVYVENPTEAPAAKEEEALAMENPLAAECEGEKTAIMDSAAADEPVAAPDVGTETHMV